MDRNTRYTTAELSLMKNTFAGNKDFLMVIRKAMLGFETNPDEKKLIKSLLNDNVFNLLKKVLVPTLSPDVPLFALGDMVMGLQNDMKTRPQSEVEPLIRAKALEIKYLNQRFEELLGNKVENPITMESLIDLESEDAFVNITARNYLLNHIDSFLNEIIILAGTKEETVEKTLERLKKNSTK